MHPSALQTLPPPLPASDPRMHALRQMDGEEGRAAAARELQTVFLTELVGALRKTLPEGSLIPKTPGSDVFEGVFDRELAAALGRGDPLGLIERLAGKEAAADAGRPESTNGLDRPVDVRALSSRVVASATGRPVLAVAPLEGRLTSPYGPREDPITGERGVHRGVDLAAPSGTPVRAVAAGRVVEAGWAGSAGHRVIVEHDGGYRTVYAHAARSMVKPGEAVVAGQIIAAVGSTGRATGPHLHFEVRRNGVSLDPARASLTAEAIRRAVTSEDA